jgi:hypothetical protein
MMADKNNDDLLLEQFLAPAREQQIEDRGFTQRVMQQLPDRAWRLSQWWTFTCVALALALFVVFKGWQPMLAGLFSLLHVLTAEVKPIPLFIGMGVVCSLSLLSLVQRFERGYL